MRWLKKALGLAGRKAAEDHCMKGYVAAREGRLDDAQRHYDDAVAADETLAVAAFNAGQTALERYNRDAANLDDAGRRARLETARGWLEKAVAVDDDHAPSWRALARVRERLGDVAGAVLAWERVEQTLHVEEGGPVAAVVEARAEARRERARLAPAAALALAIRRGRELLTADVVEGADATSALDALVAAREAAVAMAASSSSSSSSSSSLLPAGLATLMGCLARRGGDPRARVLLEEAVAADPRDLEAVRNLATLCLASGDLPAALRASQAAYRLDPVDAGLVCNVGVCHLALARTGDVVDEEQLGRAREFITLAKQLSPKDPIVLRAVAALG
jgi:tetratricopeptide (TPR) repeat protein